MYNIQDATIFTINIETLVVYTRYKLSQYFLINENSINEDALQYMVFLWLRHILDSKQYWRMLPHGVTSFHFKARLLERIGFSIWSLESDENLHTQLDEIETKIRELVEIYVPLQTWHIWTIELVGGTSFRLFNLGDYRIESWADNVTTLDPDMATYPTHVLKERY